MHFEGSMILTLIISQISDLKNNVIDYLGKETGASSNRSMISCRLLSAR